MTNLVLTPTDLLHTVPLVVALVAVLVAVLVAAFIIALIDSFAWYTDQWVHPFAEILNKTLLVILLLRIFLLRIFLLRYSNQEILDSILSGVRMIKTEKFLLIRQLSGKSNDIKSGSLGFRRHRSSPKRSTDRHPTLRLFATLSLSLSLSGYTLGTDWRCSL